MVQLRTKKCVAHPLLQSADELAHDISSVLVDVEDDSHTVVLHLLDNSIFKREVDNELTDPIKLNGSYHVRGELQLIDSLEMKRLFETALPILRACTGANTILLGPLPRYLITKCCEDKSHITNFTNPNYVAEMARHIRDLGK